MSNNNNKSFTTRIDYIHELEEHTNLSLAAKEEYAKIILTTDGRINRTIIDSCDAATASFLKSYANHHQLPIQSSHPTFGYYNQDENFCLFLKDVSSYPLLTAEEESILIVAAQNGDRLAEEKLVNSNLRLLINIAKDYRDKGFDFEDLIQEGYYGLVKAIQNFDFSRANRLSTYTSYWIPHTIRRAIANKAETIRTPANLYTLLTTYRAQYNEFYKKNNRHATAQEMASILNLTPSEANELYRLNIATSYVCLNAYAGENQVHELTEYLPDETSQIDVDTLDLQDRVDHLFETSHLEIRELDVLKRLYGFNAYGDCETLDGIGKTYGLTRERIRQISLLAIKKIISNPEFEAFYVYANNPLLAAEHVTNILSKKKKK